MANLTSSEKSAETNAQGLVKIDAESIIISKKIEIKARQQYASILNMLILGNIIVPDPKASS